MAYQVIARKFRPQCFDDFIGQKHVTQTLVNALNSDRFPHAVLLTGPRGTGKTTIARILAKTLLCQHKKNNNPCNQCQSCLEIKKDSHLDVIEIDGASNNGVDHIRELRNTIGYRPALGPYKIYIIDEVHMLSISAFNALLKTLEEPPNHVIFIFATTEVQKIPLTILSRCQRFDFRNHSLSDIKNNLQKICFQESIDFEEKVLWILAKQAKGSIRDSLTFLDQLTSFGNGLLTLKNVMSILGLTDRNLLFKTLQAINESNNDFLFEALQNLKESGFDPILFVEEFLEILRDCLLVKMGSHKQKNIGFSENEIEELEKLSSNLKTEKIHFLFDIILTDFQKINFSNDPYLGVEMLFFKLISLTRGTENFRYELDQSEQKTDKKISASNFKKGENKGEAVIDSSKKKITTKTDNPPFLISTIPVGRTWPEFVHAVKQSNGFLGALLEHTSIFKQDEKTIYLGLSEKMSFLIGKLKEQKNRERTENFLRNFWSDKRKVEFSVLDKNHIHENFSPKEIEKKVRVEEEKKEISHIDSHPLVETAEEIFKDHIKRVDIKNVTKKIK